MRRLELTVPNPGGMGVNQLKLSGLKSARAMDFHTLESRLWFAYLRNPNQSGSHFRRFIDSDLLATPTYKPTLE